MRKNVFGRQLKRDANERKALFKNLLTSLVLEERITTTTAKAKAIKGAADKLITKAKKGGSPAFRRLAPDVSYVAVEKLITTIAPRFANRQGGYTRIIKVGRRIADNAPQVILEWVEKGEKTKIDNKKVKKTGEKATKEQKGTKKSESKTTATLAKSKKDTKKVTSAAPKQMVTRQKKG